MIIPRHMWFFSTPQFLIAAEIDTAKWNDPPAGHRHFMCNKQQQVFAYT